MRCNGEGCQRGIPYLKGKKMEIRTYDLVIDTETKQSKLRVKESFECSDDYYDSPLSVFRLMRGKFCLPQMADEYVYMLAFNTKMKCKTAN